MRRALPLFPLRTVLYPGLVLPLHVFEERYRSLVADLLEPRSSPAELGIIALRHGRDTDPATSAAVYDVGCVARIRRIRRTVDGRYHVITAGVQRFRLLAWHDPTPYPLAEVEAIDDPDDADNPVDPSLLTVVRIAFAEYVALVSASPGQPPPLTLPEDPRALSYLVAATMTLPVRERQQLLEAPDAAARLALERELLRRECTLIRTLGTFPVTDAGIDPLSRN